MKKLIIISIGLLFVCCSKRPTSQIQSCTFKYVYKSNSNNKMACRHNEVTDTINSNYYELSETYTVNIGNLIHGSHQVSMNGQLSGNPSINDSIQVFGYLNGVLQDAGMKEPKNFNSSAIITFTW